MALMDLVQEFCLFFVYLTEEQNCIQNSVGFIGLPLLLCATAHCPLYGKWTIFEHLHTIADIYMGLSLSV